MTTLLDIKVGYCRADRCWKSNNLRSCLQICDHLTHEINEFSQKPGFNVNQAYLKQLVWSLKIKCLSEDCYVDESLLLNEDDIGDEYQVHTFTANSINRPGPSRQNVPSSVTVSGRQTSRRLITSGTSNIGQERTGIVTGRMPSVSSRHISGRASSSYRPLTTSLTASQTAFSRSTRPLLKYATDQMLSKITYEYLYSVQRVTNKCPDYRQCLEYLNIVQQSSRERSREKSPNLVNKQNIGQLVSILDEDDDVKNGLKHLEAFWLLAFGVCYYNLHINKIALDYFEAAKRADQMQLDAYLWLIKIYLRQNEPMKVLKICDDGLRNSKNAIMFNWKARVQSLLNDSYAAHLSLKSSLKYFPTNVEALANVGHFSFYGDRLEQALKCFERINQLTTNTHGSQNCLSGDSINLTNSNSELLNNLALCNFYCGNLTRVVPLFQQAFQSSPSKEVTSNIWYNLSFIPLSLAFKNLAIACLNLALKNNSQNEEAINNLGVLKYGPLINDSLHFANRQELWSTFINDQKRHKELKNLDHLHRRLQMLYDEAETHFSAPSLVGANHRDELDEDQILGVQPEMLFNMAVLKYKRGQLLSSIKYCHHYLEYDKNNYMILSLLRDIKQLI